MAGWVKGPSGAAVWQDDAGLVHIKDPGGSVQPVAPAMAARLLKDPMSGFSAASADDLNGHPPEEQTSALGAAARHAAVGGLGALAAVPKLATGLGAGAVSLTSQAMGLGPVQIDPLANVSGRSIYSSVAPGTTEENRRQLALDEAQHPVASTVGEIGGNVAGAALTGGGAAALAGKAASGLGLAGNAARLATGVGGSAIEGAGLGADAVAEQAWSKGDPAVTAEQTLAGIGLGFGIGGIGHAAVGAGGAAIRKLLGRGVTEAAGTGIEGAAARAESELNASEAVQGSTIAAEAPAAVPPLENVSNSVSGGARKWISGLADDAAFSSVARGEQSALKNLGSGKAPTPELMADVGKFLNESGIVGLGSETAALERASAVTENAGQKIGSIMETLDQKAPYVDAKPVVGRLDDLLDKMKSEAWLPEEESAAAALEKRTQKIRELAENGIVSHSDLWDYRRSLDKLSKWTKRAAPTETQEAVRAARRVVEGELEKSIESAGRDLGQEIGSEYLAAKRAFRFGSWAEDTIEQRVGIRVPANRMFSLTDHGVGAAALIASGGHALPALAAAGANKILRERGMSTFAWLARRVAADSIDVSAAPAAASGIARNVRTMVTKSESHMADGIGRFLGAKGEGGFAGKPRVSTASAIRSADLPSAQKAYQNHAKQVQDVASQPPIASARLASITGTNLPNVAPTLHAAMAAVFVRGAQYLASNLPAPPTDPDSITPQLDSPPPVSAGDLHSYASRVEGVEDPLSLIDDLNSGRVSPEKVDAIKAVWPKIFARIQQVTFENLSQRTPEQGPVPYDKRVLLDLALDGKGALEPSLRASSLAVMKQVQQFQESQLKMKAPRPSSGGSPKIGNMLQTSSERIASR